MTRLVIGLRPFIGNSIFERVYCKSHKPANSNHFSCLIRSAIFGPEPRTPCNCVKEEVIISEGKGVESITAVPGGEFIGFKVTASKDAKSGEQDIRIRSQSYSTTLRVTVKPTSN
jgi:hypothetical protein